MTISLRGAVNNHDHGQETKNRTKSEEGKNVDGKMFHLTHIQVGPDPTPQIKNPRVRYPLYVMKRNYDS
ncbi:MAG: hypothetical protein ABIU05_26480 [Nitrospirales bacterium]